MEMITYMALPCPLPEEARAELAKAGALAVEMFDRHGYGSSEHKAADQDLDRVLEKLMRQHGVKVTRPEIPSVASKIVKMKRKAA